MRTLTLLVLSSLAVAAEPAARSPEFWIPACEKERRWVLAEGKLPGESKLPLSLQESETGNEYPAQVEGTTIRWVVPSIPPGVKRRYLAVGGGEAKTGMSLAEGPGGSLSIKGPKGEITRFYPTAGIANKKPCLYPLNVGGVNILRGYPLEDRPGEAKDHPHHTGIYHAFGDVNGKDYWSKTGITNTKILKKVAGPAFAHVVVENAWGEDLVEVWDVKILNAGDEAVIDFGITLTAANGPVVLGKDQKMAKEGSFSVRVGPGLSDNAKKDPGAALMFDSKGNKGEKAVRADTAPWVAYTGEAEGKKVGVAVMDHPESFRHPTTWHARAYGLFAANPWYVAEAKASGRTGEHTLQKGESLKLRYRIYAHPGAEGKVAEAFAGFTNAKATPE